MSTTPDPDLNATEKALQALVPEAGALNRDRLMYEAGRRARRPSAAWPAATGAFAVLSAFLGMRLATVTESAPSAPAIMVKAVDQPPPPVVQETIRERPSTGLLQLLLHGVPDSLPAEPARVRQIEDWLRGGPADWPTNPAVSRPLASPDDSSDSNILRRGRL